LSNRYGTKCLQSKITADEYSQVCEALYKDEDRELIHQFYELDKNYIKNQIYFLKPKKESIHKVFLLICFSLISFLILIVTKGKEYDKKSKELLNLISKTVKTLFKKGIFNVDQQEHYLSSG
jgi:hypothetical protein